jgi:hypothetical protein
MENSTREERNKPHNQASNRTHRVEHIPKAPHHQTNHKDQDDKDNTQQSHQQRTNKEETNTTKGENTATQLCNTETKKVPRMVPRKKPPQHDKRNTTQQSHRTPIGK